MATQLPGKVMPIRNHVRREKARAITAEERKGSVFVALRQARSHKRLFGLRKKKAEAEAEAKK